MKHPQLKRWAVVSPSRVKKVAVFMMAIAIGKDTADVAWFQDTAAAVAWLK
jgi:hypothetical protein